MATNIPKKTRKGTPPAPAETKDTLSRPEPGATVALNFRVTAEFKRDFKVTAAMKGITQSQLLQDAFREWMERHG